MDDVYLRKIMTTIILVVLIVLSFFLLKPILLSIITGLILAFIFTPLYSWINKYIKSGNISSFLICLILIFLILLPLWFLVPIIIEQSVRIFLALQQIDFVASVKNVFPSLFSSEEFSAEIGSVIRTFVTKATSFIMDSISKVILNFPTLLLQSFVVFFTLFFVLRDKDQIVSYMKSLSPFSKDIEKKLFDSSKAITSSLLYGQIIIGIIQGLFVGIGFFLLGIPNALFLTVLACLAGVLPIIGTTIIWIPVAIYLFVIGDTLSTLGIVIFGLVSSSIDNLLKPIFVSKRTHMNSLLILAGMIGGLFLFGILGFILGPLILAYLLIILELYRNKKVSSIFIQEKPSR